jgi:short-subunit dehydrogenase
MTPTEEYQDNNQQTILERFLFPVCNYNTNKLEKAVSKKTILITGASFGIGAVVAEQLSNFDVTLLLVARTEQKLIEFKEICKERPCKISIYSTDLRDENQVNKLILDLEGIKIDVFINNAGKSINRGLASSLDRFQDTQRCSATNYTGPVQLLLGILPAIIKKRGQIINVSALNVLLPPTAGWSAYQSSKAAFDQWLRCMEPELYINEVTVSHIYLPLVRTRMSMINEKNYQRPAMSKSKAATVILKSIASRKRKYRPWWTGFVLFWCSLFPDLWYRLQVRHLKNRQ